jgi:hypothetical protein
MSMEIRTFFSGALPAPTDVGRALARQGFGFAFAEPTVALDEARGFVPMMLGAGDDAEETGCEVYVGPAAETIAELGIAGVDPALDREVSMRWGGDALEGASACALVAALAELTGGVIFDDAAGAIVTVDTARRTAAELIALAEKA